MNLEQIIEDCRKTKDAARNLVTVSSDLKNKALLAMAESLTKNSAAIKKANRIDLENARAQGLSDAMVDRLTISDKTIEQMGNSLKEVVALNDPLEADLKELVRPNGIKVRKKRIPLGVILMIYESRPNVTVEAGSLALKSGNGIILRGGKEAFESNQILASCWREALQSVGLSPDLVQVLSTTERSVLDDLLKLDEMIDVVIPRGGEGLIKYVVANSHIPVIKHYKGVCHLFVDESADFEKAIKILLNGKTQRPGVCNALEGMIVHQKIAKEFLPVARKELDEFGVEILGCEETVKVLTDISKATKEDFDTEFLSLKMVIKVVADLEQAISFIDRYGSGHTEVIVTEDAENADRFLNRIDASVVMVNASSRFSDGGELGLGAEIGISTSKIHAYGPMGLESLTSEKFIVVGEGQVRE